jgi:hypothetical protein
MRHLTRPLIPVLILFLASVSVAHAQTRAGGGGTGTGGGGSGFGGGGGGSNAGGGMGGGSSGGLGFGGGGLGGGSGSGSSMGGRAGTSATLSQSNFLAPSYVNAYATGLYTDATLSSGTTSEGKVTVGGSGTSNSPKTASTFFKTVTFGQPLYNIATSNRTGGGTATVRSGTTGNRGGTGTASVTGQGDFGPVVSGVRAPFVATTIRFATTPISADTMTRDLRDLVTRSTTVTAKNNINIQVQDRIVRLTGTVATDDERRHVAQLIQLSQGVRGVINDLEVK